MSLSRKQPQHYAILSNADMLAAATMALEEDVASGKVTDADLKIKHIDNLLRLPRATSETPFIKMGLHYQPRLIDGLVQCLNPALQFEMHNRLNSKTSVQLTALKCLTEIDSLRDDSNYSSFSSLQSVSDALSKIICSPTASQELVDGYHKILVRWPNFMRHHADAYREALHDLSALSLMRDDIMTYNWIRHTAVHEINRVSPEKPNSLRSGGAKPSAAAG